MVIILTSLVLLIVALAEFMHLRRCWLLRSFLFNGCTFPWGALGGLAIARCAGCGCLAIGLAVLWVETLHPAALNSAFDTEETDRLLIVLDSSLSMNLKDAGPEGNISRGARAADLIAQLLQDDKRKPPRTTLVVFADKSNALAVDTNDWNVIRHSLNNRHLAQVLFDDETTTIGAVLRQVTDEFAKNWPARSTTLLLITDGDSEDQVGELALPRSIRSALVIGVGSAEGRLIGSFQSRQDERSLREIAQALGGRYVNGNASAVPQAALGRPSEEPAETKQANGRKAAPDMPDVPLGERPVLPLTLIGIGASLLAALTILSLYINPANRQPIRDESSPFLS